MTLEERLKRLSDKGWAVTFTHTWFGYWELDHAEAGDTNCPHPKEWDPSDGHGYSYIHGDDVDITGLPEETPMEWWLDRLEPMIDAIVPGAKR